VDEGEAGLGAQDRQAAEAVGEGVPEGEEPPPYPKGFIVLPRRWVAERTIAWICRNRRMSRDYEFLAESGEALIHAAMIRLMVRRLAKRAA
jgi:transposase